MGRSSQDDGVAEEVAGGLQHQRFKATCQARQRPESSALQPHARSVCPAATTGIPPVPRAFVPVVRDGYAATNARVRHTGEIGAEH